MKPAPHITVNWLDDGETKSCDGVALTRYHVLASKACIPPQRESFKVVLHQGKTFSRRGQTIQLPTEDKISVIVLRMKDPIRYGGGISIRKIESGSIRVSVGQVDVPCQLQSSTQVSCSNPPQGAGWPVFSSNNELIGFYAKKQTLQPLDDEMDIVALAISEDFAQRYSKGERRLFKCKQTEISAIEFLLVSKGTISL